MMKDLDFTSREVRKEFIANNPSSIYDGTNVDGERVTVELEQGVGMTVNTIRHGKPKWVEVAEYDKDGWLEGQMYLPSHKEEESK